MSKVSGYLALSVHLEIAPGYVQGYLRIRTQRAVREDIRHVKLCVSCSRNTCVNMLSNITRGCTQRVKQEATGTLMSTYRQWPRVTATSSTRTPSARRGPLVAGSSGSLSAPADRRPLTRRHAHHKAARRQRRRQVSRRRDSWCR